MNSFRTLLAIVLSFLVLLIYQYYFVVIPPPPPEQTAQPADTPAETVAPPPAAAPASASAPSVVAVDSTARKITVDTPLYTVIFNEQGGGIQDFVLKRYRNTLALDSGPMRLVNGGNPSMLAAQFALDNGSGQDLPLFHAERTAVELKEGEQTATLNMVATLAEGLRIIRTLTFHADSYLIDMQYTVANDSDAARQVSPALVMVGEPFVHTSQSSKYLFSGPASYVNGDLVEVKSKKLQAGPVVQQGRISWTGYVDNYFMTSVALAPDQNHTVTLYGMDDRVRAVVSEGLRTLGPGASSTFAYALYLGPKKLQVLEGAGYDLAKSVDFGWFDILAKPMLWLLNFFYSFIGNYGVAIILLTILIKLALWPVTQKGLSSMKNLQKLQPKIAKLREKYKDDPATMNQEMMALYKVYKVNPMGGCLPLLIQIPFFFALYRVLMAAIELRHAPFALWINDLSAPDRLWIGFDIPYLHGLPVLTLLMGVTMYFQQKMTPTVGDPMQARMMQFLPLLFIVMFINFASGLVLYWFVNNLLSILQQYLINKKHART
ncbi:MAG: membrane protein insertase YidC [Desulfobulbus sp.]|jgi:YidC/Oxa1 family membrane protein insertase